MCMLVRGAFPGYPLSLIPAGDIHGVSGVEPFAWHSAYKEQKGSLGLCPQEHDDFSRERCKLRIVT